MSEAGDIKLSGLRLEELDQPLSDVIGKVAVAIPQVEDIAMQETGRTIRIIRRWMLGSISPSLARLIETPPTPDMAAEITERKNAKFRARYQSDMEFRERRQTLKKFREERRYGLNISEKARKVLSEEEKRVKNLKLRQRYRTDPDYRAKRASQARAGYLRFKETNPGVPPKYHLDKAYREKKKEQLRRKYHENAEFAEKRRQQSKRNYEARKLRRIEEGEIVISRNSVRQLDPYRSPRVPQAVSITSHTVIENQDPAAEPEYHSQLQSTMNVEYSTQGEADKVLVADEVTDETKYQLEHIENLSGAIPGGIPGGIPEGIPETPEAVMVQTDEANDQDLVYVCPMEFCHNDLHSLHDLQLHFTEKHPDVMVMFKNA